MGDRGLGAELRYNCHPAAPGERWRRDSHPAQVCVCQERPLPTPLPVGKIGYAGKSVSDAEGSYAMATDQHIKADQEALPADTKVLSLTMGETEVTRTFSENCDPEGAESVPHETHSAQSCN